MEKRVILRDDDYIIEQLIKHVDQTNQDEINVVVRYIRQLLREAYGTHYC